jgi:hypothetical protein
LRQFVDVAHDEGARTLTGTVWCRVHMQHAAPVELPFDDFGIGRVPGPSNVSYHSADLGRSRTARLARALVMVTTLGYPIVEHAQRFALRSGVDGPNREL